MCGIVGIVSGAEVADRLVDGLRRLEYRGYDSAGVCTLDEGRFQRRRAEGKLRHLAERLAARPLAGTLGIGHTRWATHGPPTEANAHPHATGRVALVHNGIIENFRPLRDALEADGIAFESETDTEVIAQLLDQALADGARPRDAVAEVLGRLEGAFALAILFADEPDRLYGARRGSPLVLGHGEGEMFLGSDALALAPLTQRVTYLDEGDWCVATREGATLFDAGGREVARPTTLSGLSGASAERGNHRHFMAKEMHEQPSALADTLAPLVDPLAGRVLLPDEVAAASGLHLAACGSAHYAGMIARYWVEGLARLPVQHDVASEFRYRDPVLAADALTLVVSQSGETADTLAALRHAAAGGGRTAAVVNVLSSTIAREAGHVLPTLAGPEIGVASTKAFTAQLAVLAALAVGLASARGRLSAEEEAALVAELRQVPGLVRDALALEDEVARLAEGLHEARHMLFLGRGPFMPLALEGALKMKEISYIHAEGQGAGELKHGPIALVDEHVPVVAIGPMGPRFDKLVSNLEEVRARKGRVLLLTDPAGAEAARASADQLLVLDGSAAQGALPIAWTIAATVPLQLLAYHVACLRGTDVDQPRNLAKSVTVE